MSTLSQILRTARKAKKLTLAQASAAFGVSRDVVRNWECGGAAPKLGVVLLVCEVYGVGSTELLQAASSAWLKSIKTPATPPAIPASVFHLHRQTESPRIAVGGGLKFMCIDCNTPASQFGSKKVRGGFRCRSCVNSKQKEAA